MFLHGNCEPLIANQREIKMKTFKHFCIAFLVALLVTPVVTGCQSRAMSRFTGTNLKLKLPKDCVDLVSFSSGRKGEKDILYRTEDGTYKVRTYTDWGTFQSGITFVPVENKSAK